MTKASRIQRLVLRIQNDFLSRPGLALTRRGVARRFDADEILCGAVLTALVDAHVLARNRDGSFFRFFPRLAHPLARQGRPLGRRRTAAIANRSHALSHAG